MKEYTDFLGTTLEFEVAGISLSVKYKVDGEIRVYSELANVCGIAAQVYTPSKSRIGFRLRKKETSAEITKRLIAAHLADLSDYQGAVKDIKNTIAAIQEAITASVA